MTKFRWHRGSFNEAMKTVVEFNTKAELIDHIASNPDIYEFYPHPINEDTVHIEPYGYGPRIEWNTHIVSLDAKIIGFTNGNMN